MLFNFQGPSEGKHHGGVAQLGEHLPCKQGVMGSNPIISTRMQSESERPAEEIDYPQASKEERAGNLTDDTPDSQMGS